MKPKQSCTLFFHYMYFHLKMFLAKIKTVFFYAYMSFFNILWFIYVLFDKFWFSLFLFVVLYFETLIIISESPLTTSAIIQTSDSILTTNGTGKSQGHAWMIALKNNPMTQYHSFFSLFLTSLSHPSVYIWMWIYLCFFQSCFYKTKKNLFIFDLRLTEYYYYST